jgi:hydrogenase maturation protease
VREELLNEMGLSQESCEAVMTESYGTTPSAQPRPDLVLGIGNILLRDEGLGVRVVEAMQEQDLPAEVEVFDGATFGIDLLDVLADRRKVIVIDAIDIDRSRTDYPPGTVMQLDLNNLQAWRGPEISLHDVGLLDTLAVASLLECAPEQVVIFGVVPKIVEEGLELSEELSAVVPEVVRLVLTELGRCQNQNT